MIAQKQALHKAEKHFSELQGLVVQAINEGWRADEVERATFTKLLDIGYELMTALIAAQGDGDERGRNPGGVAGRFCANWLRFSKKIPSKSLIA